MDKLQAEVVHSLFSSKLSCDRVILGASEIGGDVVGSPVTVAVDQATITRRRENVAVSLIDLIT